MRQTKTCKKNTYPAMGRWLCAGLLPALLVGCGYSNKSLHRETIHSVYVEMFQSKEFRRGIEFQLTEALRKQIDRATPYKNAPPEKADTILTGEVLEWRQSAIGRDPLTNLPREIAATLAISYRWQDRRTGKLLIDQPNLLTTVQYVRLRGESTYNAREDAANKMARKVVQSMERPW